MRGRFGCESLVSRPSRTLLPRARRSLVSRPLRALFPRAADDGVDCFVSRLVQERAIEPFNEEQYLETIRNPVAHPSHDAFLPIVNGNVYAHHETFSALSTEEILCLPDNMTELPHNIGIGRLYWVLCKPGEVTAAFANENSHLKDVGLRVVRTVGDVADVEQQLIVFVPFHGNALDGLYAKGMSSMFCSPGYTGRVSHFDWRNLTVFTSMDSFWKARGEFLLWATPFCIQSRGESFETLAREDSQLLEQIITDNNRSKIKVQRFIPAEVVPDWLWSRVADSTGFDVAFGDVVELTQLPTEACLSERVTTTQVYVLGAFLTRKKRGGLVAHFKSDDDPDPVLFRTYSTHCIKSVTRGTPNTKMRETATRLLGRLRNVPYSSTTGVLPFMKSDLSEPEPQKTPSFADSSGGDRAGRAARMARTAAKIPPSASEDSEKFMCDHPGCGKSFGTSQGLKVHKGKAHANATPRSPKAGDIHERLKAMSAELSAQRKRHEAELLAHRDQSAAASSGVMALQQDFEQLRASLRTIEHDGYDAPLRIGSAVMASYDDDSTLYNAVITRITDEGNISLLYDDDDSVSNVDPAEYLCPPDVVDDEDDSEGEDPPPKKRKIAEDEANKKAKKKRKSGKKQKAKKKHEKKKRKAKKKRKQGKNKKAKKKQEKKRRKRKRKHESSSSSSGSDDSDDSSESSSSSSSESEDDSSDSSSESN